jgi:hypothetical protein
MSHWKRGRQEIYPIEKGVRVVVLLTVFRIPIYLPTCVSLPRLGCKVAPAHSPMDAARISKEFVCSVHVMSCCIVIVIVGWLETKMDGLSA